MPDNTLSSRIKHKDSDKLDIQEVLSYQMHDELIKLIHNKLTEFSGRELITIIEVQDLFLDLILQIQKDSQQTVSV